MPRMRLARTRLVFTCKRSKAVLIKVSPIFNIWKYVWLHMAVCMLLFQLHISWQTRTLGVRCSMPNSSISSVIKYLHKLTISILVFTALMWHITLPTRGCRSARTLSFGTVYRMPRSLYSVSFVKQESVHCPHLPDAICKRRGASQIFVRPSNPNWTML